MASTSASALILSPACFTRTATVSTLVVGRPLKLTPFPFAWTLVGRVGFVGLAGVAGLVAARLVPDGFALRLVDGCRRCGGQVVPAGCAVLGFLVGVDLPGDVIEGIRLGRGCLGCRFPALPGLLPAAAGRRLVALGGLSGRPGGRCCGCRLSWSCHAGNPHACLQAGLSYSHRCRRPRAANNPTCASTLPFNVLPAALTTVRRPDGAWSRRRWRPAPPRRRTGLGHSRARCGAGWQARWPRPAHCRHRHGRGRRGRTPGGGVGHCCIWRPLKLASSTRVPERPRRWQRLTALSTSGSRTDGKRLHFATRQPHHRARCNSAIEAAGELRAAIADNKGQPSSLWMRKFDPQLTGAAEPPHACVELRYLNAAGSLLGFCCQQPSSAS